MCYYPTLILNKRYRPTRKNGYEPPTLEDQRLKYVAVGCGRCAACRRAKSNEWKVRLHEEIKFHPKYNYFITLSFSPNSLEELSKIAGKEDVNKVATLAVRRFLERWRKKYKKSLKHWLVTELGDNYTERIHLHGIIFCEDEKQIQSVEKIWGYGNIYIGQFCSNRTINYIVKYIHKIDPKHKNFQPICLCSAGLGKAYVNEQTKEIHKYRPKNSVEYYTLPNGAKINLPIYYRNKFFNEKEREKLWQEKIEKEEIYIDNNKLKIRTPEEQKIYFKILKEKQAENKALGYGDDSKEWKKRKYAITLQMLNNKQDK